MYVRKAERELIQSLRKMEDLTKKNNEVDEFYDGLARLTSFIRFEIRMYEARLKWYEREND